MKGAGSPCVEVRKAPCQNRHSLQWSNMSSDTPAAKHPSTNMKRISFLQSELPSVSKIILREICSYIFALLAKTAVNLHSFLVHLYIYTYTFLMGHSLFNFVLGCSWFLSNLSRSTPWLSQHTLLTMCCRRVVAKAWLRIESIQFLNGYALQLGKL
jgi:hypothetical protein